MSATIPSTQQQWFHPRSNARATLTAFLAIVSRDLLVIRREVITFLLQTLSPGWVLLALCTSFIICLWGGIKLFRRRVVS